MTAQERMRATILDLFGTIDRERRTDAMDGFFAPGYVRHDIGGDGERADFWSLMQALHDAFPDLAAAVEQVVVEDDRAAYSWAAQGTHRGAFMGVPPTHKRVTVRGIAISRFDADGRIVEDWSSWNAASVLASLGIIPIG